MPGEVSLEYDALTLVCPAGPPITWTMSYRSMAPVSSAHGPGWDFAYNVFIEAASSGAPTVTIHDGTGRADVFRRAADGSYRCDGFSRVGQFAGDVFTLTFANRGTWTFRALAAPVAAGRIETITDPNGNAVTCDYDVSGRLSSVSSQFGQSLAVTWSGDRVASITDHAGRSVSFGYFGAGETGGPEGDLKSIGCPAVAGLPPAAGDTTFTYSSGTGTPRLDHNLLSVTDGTGRVLESFSYATTTTSGDPDFDTLVAHSAHDAGHNLGMTHDVDGTGHRVVFENDELGRVTETVFDRLHRPIVFRQHTGFHPSPGGPVAATDFPLAGKLRSTDPDFFVTTWSYNADSNVTRLVRADGSQDRLTYQRDLDPACAVLERGNARVQTLVSSLGEARTVTMEYEPNSGTPESARPGNPIGGISIKGGRNPGGNPSARPGNPIGGLNIKGGKNPGGALGKSGYATRRRVEVLKSNKIGDPNANRGITINTSHIEYETAKRLIWSPRSNFGGPDNDCDGLLVAFLSKKGYDYYKAGSDLQAAGRSKKGYDYYQAHSAMRGGGGRKGWDGTIKGSTFARTGLPDYLDEDDDDDGVPTSDEDDFTARPGAPIKGLCVKMGGPRHPSRMTKLSTSHGQSFTWTYDAAGNCVTATTPISGGGAVYVYDTHGRLTSATRFNGTAGEFHDALSYGPDGFLHTHTEDPGGRNLVTTYEHDSLGRVTRIVDPMSDDWLLTWSPLDVCTQTQSPPVAGQRVATSFAYDASGRLVRCDVEHRDAAGALDSTNPAYSTFWSYDSRGRLARIALEERPTDTTGLLEPDPMTLANFAVTDFTYDHAGQVVRASTPAACRGQSTDAIVDLSYDERGFVHRCVAGGNGNPSGVTIEYDYDRLGARVREACVSGSGGATTTLSQTLYTYDGFHRPSSITDAMGNRIIFDYGNDGYVTCSVFGEVEDLPGDGGNTLLFRMRKRPEVLFQAWDDTIQELSLPGVQDACYGLETTRSAARGSGPRKATGSNSWDAGASRHYAHVDCPRRSTDACFSVYLEDDSVEVERFAPGDLPPFAKETTLIDRSPAGLVMNVSRNGDLLAACSYDSNGTLISVSNAARTIDFDRDGREDVVVCGVTEHFRVASPPAPKIYTHTITRDALGRITAVTDGAGNTSSVTYDSLGRCTSLVDPGRAPILLAYDGEDASGPFSYVGTCDASASGTPQTVVRGLHRCGVPLSFTDSNGYATTLTRDALNRFTRCDMPDGTFETYGYDARGIVNSITHRDLSVTDLVSDPLGRVIESARHNLQLGALAVEDTLYAYDGLGRMVRAAQGASVVSMSWDSLGNVLGEGRDGWLYASSFNHRGRTSVTYPGSPTISETRDEFGQLTNVGGNQIRYVGHSVYQTVQANGVTTTYDYRGEGDTSPPGDASYGSCVRVTTVSGATTLADTLLQHTPDQRVSKARMLFSAEPTGPGRVRTFAYDGLGRVTACLTERRETLGGPVVTESDVRYTLDAAGRRVSVSGGSYPGTYTQSAANPPGDRQMGQYTSWPGGALEWDDLGNLTVFSNGTDSLDMDSDGDGRLIAVNDGTTGSPRVTYTYDALGRLASRTEHGGAGLPPVTTHFFWEGAHIAQELDDPDGTGTLSAALTFVSGDGGIKHCISTRNGTMYYPVNSEFSLSPSPYFGHSIALSDDSGALLERYDHDEAGGLLLLDAAGVSKTTEIGPVRWMAPESFRDRSSGFLHGHGTVYSPLLGAVTHKEKPKPKPKPTSSPHILTGHVTLIK